MELKARKDVDPAYTWDLSALYKDDAAWEEALTAFDKLVETCASFEGKLTCAQRVRAFYDASTEMERVFGNLYNYASLRLVEDLTDSAAQALNAKADHAYVKVLTAISFAEPEILSLSEETLQKIAQSGEMLPYRFTMEKLLLQKKHVLSAEEERLLAEFGEVLGAPGRISENLRDADMVWDSVKDSAGIEHELNGADYIQLQQSGDRVLRENSFRSFYKTYAGHVNTLAASYSGAVKAACAEAKVRRYSSSRAMSMAGEHIPETVYDELISVVREFLPAMYRYVELRKKILGLDELHYYDVYAPLVSETDAKWSYAEAQQLILEALAPLGEEYGRTVREGFASRWIDVYPNKGKRSGAFSSGTYDSYPYILTSYIGDYNSVTTVAHEMGHSMHTYRSNHAQPPQYADYTLFVAEVASTVNENLLVESMLRKTTDPQKRLFLLNQYLEGFKGTVYRQTMFAEFEKTAHEMAERGEPLTPENLNALYGKLTQDYFGPALKMDDEVALEWARIPHFYRPFYVYKYATSYCAACAISEKILSGENGAAEHYLEFLSMGGSCYPLEELKHAGVDLSEREPIAAALRKFEKILDEAEQLASELEAGR